MAAPKPLRYTFLSDHGLSLQNIWQWAKKLINDLNKRDFEIEQRLEDLEAREDNAAVTNVTNTTTEETAVPTVFTILLTEPTTAPTVGTGKVYIPIDATMTTKRLVNMFAHLATAGTGDTTILIRRERLGEVDVTIATNTILSGDKDTLLNATLDTNFTDPAFGDRHWIDLTAVGTGLGLVVTVEYEEVDD